CPNSENDTKTIRRLNDSIKNKFSKEYEKKKLKQNVKVTSTLNNLKVSMKIGTEEMEDKHVKNECVKSDCVKNECVKNECVKSDCVKNECVKSDCVKNECVKNECVKSGCVKNKCVKNDCVKNKCVKSDCVKNECVKNDCVKHIDLKKKNSIKNVNNSLINSKENSKYTKTENGNFKIINSSYTYYHNDYNGTLPELYTDKNDINKLRITCTNTDNDKDMEGFFKLNTHSLKDLSNSNKKDCIEQYNKKLYDKNNDILYTTKSLKINNINFESNVKSNTPICKTKCKNVVKPYVELHEPKKDAIFITRSLINQKSSIFNNNNNHNKIEVVKNKHNLFRNKTVNLRTKRTDNKFMLDINPFEPKNVSSNGNVFYRRKSAVNIKENKIEKNNNDLLNIKREDKNLHYTPNLLSKPNYHAYTEYNLNYTEKNPNNYMNNDKLLMYKNRNLTQPCEVGLAVMPPKPTIVASDKYFSYASNLQKTNISNESNPFNEPYNIKENINNYDYLHMNMLTSNEIKCRKFNNNNSFDTYNTCCYNLKKNSTKPVHLENICKTNHIFSKTKCCKK
ncbi:exported protein (PHISTc), unknown function, partial [Hepatocystis sp. ex Piliocolobus tephrosceles]